MPLLLALIEDLNWQLAIVMLSNHLDQGCCVPEQHRASSRYDYTLWPADVHLRACFLQILSVCVPGKLQIELVEVFLTLLQLSTRCRGARVRLDAAAAVQDHKER